MSNDTEHNKNVVRRQHEEVWNRAEFESIDAIYTDDFACHFPDGLDFQGRDALKEFVAAHRRSFPDWHEVVEDLIAERDRVVSRYRSTGTQRGAFQRIAASGRKIEIQEVSIYRMERGRIAEQWGFPDGISLIRQITVAVLAAVTLFLTPLVRPASAAEQSATPLQEVIVTAQKRAQNLQDVGISITALSGDELTKLGVINTTDIARQTPGLQVNDFSPDLTVFNIRGVSQNDFSDQEEAPIAVYVDGAYVAALGALAGALYDIERVEVLRGPQGTLFGRNSTGGLIHYVTEPPTNSPEAYVSATVGSFGQVNTAGVLNGPLSESVSGRLSFATDYNNGIIENRIGKSAEQQKQYAARGQLLFKLGDATSVLVKLHVLANPHISSTGWSWRAAYPDPTTGLGVPVPPTLNYWGALFPPGCAGCDAAGYKNPASSPFDQAFDTPQDFHRLVWGSTVHVNSRLTDKVSVTSVTDFLHMDKTYREDTDMSPNPILAFQTSQSFHQFSEELRFNGTVERLTWISGLYFLDMNTNNWATVPFGSVWTFLGQPGAYYDLKTFSDAVFGQVEWAFSDRLTGIVGARYTRDEKIDDYRLYSTFPPSLAEAPAFQLSRSTDPRLADQVYNLPQWKAELDFRPREGMMVYASVNRGAKGGGFDEPFSPPIVSAASLAFRPEELTSYELGEKWTALDGKFRLNGDVFYYDYKDYQSFALVNGVSTVVTNYQAREKGGELEATLAPLTGLRLQIGVSGLSSVVRNVALPSGLIADRNLPEAPKWSITSLARYQWHAWSSSWWVQTDAKSDTPMYFETYNSPVDYEPGKTVADVSVGFVSPNAKIEVTAFCNNVTDKLYRVYSADAASVGFDNQVFAPPRWYGLTIAYHML